MKFSKLILLLTLVATGLTADAQKSKKVKSNSSGVITLTAVKLGDNLKMDDKYDWSKYYTIEKGILMPAKGVQMVYSKERKTIILTDYKGKLDEDTIADGVKGRDGSIEAVNATFHCGGCGSATECNPGIISVSSEAAVVGCSSGCDMCIGWTELNNKAKPAQVQTSGGNWNPIEDLW